MTFGVTDQGFNAKRLADIQVETTADWKQQFGDGFSLPDNSPEGQVKGILDERISLIWELADAIAQAYIPSFAQGKQVDNILALTGNVRKNATNSRTETGRAFGVFGTIIPITFKASVNGSSTSIFQITSPSSISIPAVDEIQTLNFSATPTSGTFVIVFPEDNTAAINWDDNAAAVTAACEAILGAGNIIVTGSITLATGLTLTYAAAEGAKDRAEITITANSLDAGGAVAITPATTLEGSKAKSVLLTLDAIATGPVAAPAASLTVIDTPVVGLEDFTNELDAVLGRNEETDAEAKLRRELEIQLAGAATPDAIRADLLSITDVTAVLVFENDTDIVDLDGRPPHSIDIVVEGGDEQEIGDRIWATRGGGIKTIGDISVGVLDDNGFPQVVKFSRPDPIEITIEVDIVKNSFYPPDGDDLVEAAILVYGLALIISQSVVVFGSDPNVSCSFQDVPGITDFTIRIKAGAGPTTDDNIPIAPRERAAFDSSRITIAS